jgi:restriction system protein
VLAQTVLRSLHEIYQSDVGQHIQVVVLNAHVSTVNPGTGKPIRPCLITVRTTRDEFRNLDLARIDRLACLKQLKAAVSRQPDELVAVKPIVQFDMVDPRFIKEMDVLSTIDHRPNLMELAPGEFESLITNLFSKMGLETKLTQPSRDGGVDCVAYDQRPILGGKVVIQAKRYKNTVGVSSVRDLFGTMHNEGASKGILVTTSGYGKAAYDFANNKPIELITGSNLLYLLREHANVDAKIEVPPDWVDLAIE